MQFTSEMASRIRDEIFTEDEKKLLTSVVGNTYIDIADQLLHSYGNYLVRSKNVDELVKSFAVLKLREGQYILKQLELLNTKLDELMDPEKYYSVSHQIGSSNTNLINDFESTNKNNTSMGTFTYEFDESSQESNAASLVRGANTQTSQRNKGLENKWKKDLLVDAGNKHLVGKKEFDPNKVLQEEKVLDVREAHYEIIPEERQEPEDIGGELYSTLNIGLTGTTNNIYSANNTDSLSLSRTDGGQSNTSTTYSNTDFITDKTYSQYIQNDATMKSIRLMIPNLQNKFFTIFAVLFELPF